MKAGASVTNDEDGSNDIEKLPGTSAAAKSTVSKKKQKNYSDSSGSEESDDWSAEESSDTPENFEKEEDIGEVNLDTVKIEDFLLVNFSYDEPGKKTIPKKFIGPIKEITKSNSFICSFLRKSVNDKVYLFPEIPDVAEITKLCLLKPTFIKRGRHGFSVEI